MENKYQEAKETFNLFCNECISKGVIKEEYWEDVSKMVETLQELIDKYSTMEEQVKTCEHSADKKIGQLEKALDMLLDMSVDKESGICCTYGCPNKDEDIESGSCIGKCMTKQELKEYLLKEVQDGK